MPDSLASAPSMPKTLAEAKGIIANLRRQLGTSPPPARPVPKTDPQPVANPAPPPIPKAVLDLSEMPPASFDLLLSARTNAEIKLLLARETAKGREQDSSVVGRLYRELKKRGC